MPKFKSAAGPLSSIRLIAGEWRGRRLSVLASEGLRPTTDRVRETLFNWLAPDIYGARCLDLFAGTGALGFESLSRGATFVEFCELDAKAADLIKQNLTKLMQSNNESRAKITRGDALRWLDQYAGEPFDIIFLDPPFANANLINAALARIRAGGLLAKDGLLYLECPRHGSSVPVRSIDTDAAELDLVAPPDGFASYRLQTAGKVRFGLYLFNGEV